MKKALVVLAIIFTSICSFANYQNYFGVVTRVSFLDDLGSFVVTVDSGVLDDCLYKYAYFKVNQIGQERVKMAYSMVLTSLTTKMKMNFVIDKDNKGTNGECYVGNMAAGIQSY